MSQTQDIEDYDEEVDEPVLTKQQISSLITALSREGYYFTEGGIQLIANDMTSYTPNDVCNLHHRIFFHIYTFLLFVPHF